MSMIEKSQITVGKGRGHWVKKSALDMEDSLSHFSNFKRPYGWANINEKKGER